MTELTKKQRQILRFCCGEQASGTLRTDGVVEWAVTEPNGVAHLHELGRGWPWDDLCERGLMALRGRTYSITDDGRAHIAADDAAAAARAQRGVNGTRQQGRA